MLDWPRLLLGSLWLRPYVFGFLGLHLAGASAFLGWRRTVGYTLITWGVALAAEASSIRTGIPFGWYYYLPRTAGQELWIAGVPFFDSLSFPFLLVSSYGLAWVLLSGRKRGATRAVHLGLTSLLFVLVDMVIDPVALRGDQWFLGQIYGYPEPGLYFGVPLANFLGWGIVGLTATGLYQAWEGRRPTPLPAALRGRAWLCPGLYFVVLVFNLAVTFALREWGLGLCGLTLALAIGAVTLTAPRRRAAGRWEEGTSA
ncbi:MAG TPA: carotenoid biosynthesis protein [Candidatus Sulfotelmatobacter sp.]|nr:carotenoid biosynthesis protein [Candidatus Sulfotelmatobacter sp.]